MVYLIQAAMDTPYALSRLYQWISAARTPHTAQNRTLSTANDIEMGVMATLPPPIDWSEHLMADPWQTKAARVFSTSTFIDFITLSTRAARYSHSIFYLTVSAYPLSNVDDDAVFFNPFAFTIIGLVAAEILVGTAYILNDRWQHVEYDRSRDNRGLDFLETMKAVVDMLFFIADRKNKELSSLQIIMTLIIGLVVGALQMVSDVKGEYIVSAGPSHSHPSARGRPSGQDIPWQERALNGFLRTVHLAYLNTFLFSTIDILNSIPMPHSYTANEIHDFKLALPFAILYGVVHTLEMRSLWSEHLNPTLTRIIDYIDASFHAVTNGSLAFNAIFFFSVMAQLFTMDRPNDLYLLSNPMMFWLTLLIPSLVGVVCTMQASWAEHFVAFSLELQHRLIIQGANLNEDMAQAALANNVMTVTDDLEAPTPADAISFHENRVQTATPMANGTIVTDDSGAPTDNTILNEGMARTALPIASAIDNVTTWTARLEAPVQAGSIVLRSIEILWNNATQRLIADNALRYT